MFKIIIFADSGVFLLFVLKSIQHFIKLFSTTFFFFFP